MLRARQKKDANKGVTDVLTQQLLDQLDAAKLAFTEKTQQKKMEAEIAEPEISAPGGAEIKQEPAPASNFRFKI